MRLASIVLLMAPTAALALDIALPTPPGSSIFGRSVVFLPNGNLVVTDPNWSAGAESIGAVYLFDSAGVLISRLTGSRVDDSVGSGGIVVLENGNFVVSSPDWDAPGNFADAGAVTFANAVTGFGAEAVVGADNSLIGASAGDRVGDSPPVALPNGNYAVASVWWDNGASLDAGAVTWGDGVSGTSGVVGEDNSFVGTSKADYMGIWVTPLRNGNYITGSQFWDNAGVKDAGLVSWRPGNTAAAGVAGASNSIVGTVADDRIGSGGVVALTNGNYVFASPTWDRAGVVDAGAVQWRSGIVVAIGALLEGDSIVGSTAGDSLGSGGVIALANGHYAFASPRWNHGSLVDAGAVRWGDGTKASTGVLNSANALLGASPNDSLGSGALTSLTNGNFVAVSPAWDDAAPDIGSAILMSGTGKLTGLAVASKAIVGVHVGDMDFARVTPLAKGAFVLATPFADGDNALDAGAVTWCDGVAVCSKIIGAGQSLVGSTAQDHVGSPRVLALSDGNFAVLSYGWNAPNAANAGAVTWSDGKIVGPVSLANSLVGSSAADWVGDFESSVLPDGRYLALSPLWDGPAGADVGAITFMDGGQPTSAAVNPMNSLTGPAAGEKLGMFTHAEAHGRWLVASFPTLDNGAFDDAGAVVLFDLDKSHAGPLTFDTAIRGGAVQAGSALRFDFHEASGRLAVGDPAAKLVHLVDTTTLAPNDAIFHDGFED